MHVCLWKGARVDETDGESLGGARFLCFVAAAVVRLEGGGDVALIGRQRTYSQTASGRRRSPKQMGCARIFSWKFNLLVLDGLSTPFNSRWLCI